MISPDLLEILACPLCKSELEVKEGKLHCRNSDCNLRFLVQEDIPIMLIEEAERPCPGCGTARAWEPDKDTLRCEKCSRAFTCQPPATPK